MNPLKRIVKSTLNRDPIEEIFWGSPTADTYQKVLTNYRGAAVLDEAGDYCQVSEETGES
jgi:hypothetical protein